MTNKQLQRYWPTGSNKSSFFCQKAKIKSAGGSFTYSSNLTFPKGIESSDPSENARNLKNNFGNNHHHLIEIHAYAGKKAIKASIFEMEQCTPKLLIISDFRAGSKEGQGGLAPPIDMLGPTNQQAYSFEDSSFCA